jgi:hypothetical protein
MAVYFSIFLFVFTFKKEQIDPSASSFVIHNAYELLWILQSKTNSIYRTIQYDATDVNRKIKNKEMMHSEHRAF